MPEFVLDVMPEPPVKDGCLTWMFNGYVSSLAWTATWDTDTGDPVDGYDNQSITLIPSDVRELWEAVVVFVASNTMMCNEAAVFWQAKGSTEQDAWERIGHDFALTRNHHGAGFWDRGMGKLGDILTTAAQSYGEQNIDCWVEDDELRASVR